ncbi:MAG: DNA recombination protein RmuC [Dysgonamonadaceae bacterium]|jgi:DNA recombination protein RmuC|nr:DNA recombination protein RmuC [Dysgonamonadaceae bacterium]
MEILLCIVIVLLAVNLWLAIAARKNRGDKEVLENQFGQFSKELNRIEQATKYEISVNREEISRSLRENREEIGNQLRRMTQSNEEKTERLIGKQVELTGSIELRFDKIRETVEGKLQKLQEENAGKLEEMRVIVDEKLQSSVEKRFNESFKLISERLDQVHKGLGEMQHLASGVGDLKKVLTNVKTRGTLGEIQLGNILDQVLSPEQYETNAAVKPNTQERVEYAVKLPSKNMENAFVLLPIDSKFPVEDYQRLTDVFENIDNLSQTEIDATYRQFENAVKKNAKDIRDKYINPPVTTDFAIMFVPTEGLYAEILRRTALFETLQRDYKVAVVGPSNLVAFLNSLQMGFRTLAIEKRSSEVWEILGAVKTEFGHFGDMLDKTKKKLQEAANVIDRAGIRSRAIERRLRTVEGLPVKEAVMVLGEHEELEEDALET